ncbi:MAG: hypothetical protein JW938_01575 [Candidatus Omnitrophica bacterium]|nr:hypothetical protein [Candidatus Omnitrophota bacterium]
MIEFKTIKNLFREDIYQIGVLDKEETWRLGRMKLKLLDAYSTSGVIPLDQGTEKYWNKIENSLIIVKYSDVAHDYDIKPKTQNILTAYFKKNIFMIRLDLKEAAVKAGLGCRGYNNLIWNPKFGFDCKIVAWAFCDEIKGYQKPNLPEYLPACNTDCLRCHHACPGHAFSGTTLETFRFDMTKCLAVINNDEVRHEVEARASVFSGVSGGLNHCRACQEQTKCQVTMLRNDPLCMKSFGNQ